MTRITLGPLFERPLHVLSWPRPRSPQPGWDHFRVTNPFVGPDLINGGIHGAVDIGNGQTAPAPILAAADCMARGLSHWDGARGFELMLSPRVRLLGWHLSSTLEVGTWTRVRRGQRIGATGSTGRQPMPVHTHVELWLDGAKIDPEPHLFGAPLDLDPQEDAMTQAPDGAQALVAAIVGDGNRLRVSPETKEGSRVVEGSARVQLLWRVDRPAAPWTIGARSGSLWWVVGYENRLWYVADPLVASAEITSSVGASVVSIPQADCSAQDNRIAAARTAIRGARQAHDAAGRALAVVEEGLA